MRLLTSADSIKLTSDEKEIHDIAKVPYASIPALKVGKLAVNKELREQTKRKEYGSFCWKWLEHMLLK